MRVLLIGESGCGKSSVGNTLLGSKHFVPKVASEPRTLCIDQGSGTLPSGKKIKVVEMPYMSLLNQQDGTISVTRCIKLLSPGPHAFIIVLEPTRHYKDVLHFITDLADVFGRESFFKHSLIVMVRRNDFKDVDGNLMDIHKFINNTNKDDLKELYTLCDQRIIAVENYASRHEREIYAQKVADVISSMDGYFSYDYFLLQKQEKQQEDHLNYLKNALKTQNRSSCSIL